MTETDKKKKSLLFVRSKASCTSSHQIYLLEAYCCHPIRTTHRSKMHASKDNRQAQSSSGKKKQVSDHIVFVKALQTQCHPSLKPELPLKWRLGLLIDAAATYIHSMASLVSSNLGQESSPPSISALRQSVIPTSRLGLRASSCI